ncbi:MAG: Heme binding protein [Acidimicrobiales bacterium]|nr:Heme binding protein [Acidimicrobiales bacterium]
MKGIIFNVVEEVVTDRYGDDVWDSLLEAADLEGSYTSLGSYPDDHLIRLVAAASDALSLPPDDVVRALGEGAIPLLAARYPQFFEPHSSAGSFLLTLNNIIHPEVKKLYPGASVPDFDYGEADNGDLVIGYRSERKMCALAEGFIAGAARHYGEDVTLGQAQCMNRGDEKCLIQVTFGPDSGG